jgi:hypothetical protein
LYITADYSIQPHATINLTLPSEIGNLRRLNSLTVFLDGDSLDKANMPSPMGLIPTTLGNLANLTFLRFTSVPYSGTIPTEFGDMKSLQHLDIQDALLTGLLPTQLGNLSNLQVFFLVQLSLSGSLPTELGNLANLQALFLSKLSLSGQLPTELGRLASLTHFGITYVLSLALFRKSITVTLSTKSCNNVNFYLS